MVLEVYNFVNVVDLKNLKLIMSRVLMLRIEILCYPIAGTFRHSQMVNEYRFKELNSRVDWAL